MDTYTLVVQVPDGMSQDDLIEHVGVDGHDDLSGAEVIFCGPGSLVEPLREIAEYEDHFGGPPPDDAMQAIARGALALPGRVSCPDCGGEGGSMEYTPGSVMPDPQTERVCDTCEGAGTVPAGG